MLLWYLRQWQWRYWYIHVIHRFVKHDDWWGVSENQLRISKLRCTRSHQWKVRWCREADIFVLRMDVQCYVSQRQSFNGPHMGQPVLVICSSAKILGLKWNEIYCHMPMWMQTSTSRFRFMEYIRFFFSDNKQQRLCYHVNMYVMHAHTQTPVWLLFSRYTLVSHCRFYSAW